MAGMHHLPCRAVLFDLDGVLVDSVASIELAVFEWTQLVGADFDLIKKSSQSLTDEDLIRMIGADLDIAREKQRIKELEIKYARAVTAQPGAQQVLAQVQQALMPWAIVTSGQKDVVMARLVAAELPILEVMITADDYRNGKPNPEPYLLAAKLLGVPPSDCVAIEDTYNGAYAAWEAGAAVIGLTTTCTRRELIDVTTTVVPDLSAIRVDGVGILF